MTQQYYDPNAQQPYPQQAPLNYGPPAQGGYAPAPQGYQPNPYGQAPQGYGPPQQQYPGQQMQAPQGPPAPVGAKGTVDQFFKQPTPGGGKGVSWKNKPDGYTYVGVINRTPGDNDLFQDSDPQTKQLKTWRDGSPKMVMPVPLDLVFTDAWQAQEYADGEARVFLRGEMLAEFTRAMSEVGRPEGTVPEKGTLVYVTITGRKPGRGTMAANQFRVIYLPAGTWEQDPQHAWVTQQLVSRQGAAPQATQPAPYQQQYAAQAPAQGVQAYGQAQPNPQQYAAPQYGAPAAYDPNQYRAPQQPQAPAYGPPSGQYAPTQGQLMNAGVQSQFDFSQLNQQAAPNPPQAPVQGQLPGMPPTPPQAPPAGGAMGAPDPHKAALLAQLQGGGQQAPNPQQ